MKTILIGLAVLAATAYGEYSSEYQVPQVQDSLAVLEEIEALPKPHAAQAVDDGYRYKTVKRFRHRRDVRELTQYLPPVEAAPSNQYLAPSNEYLAPSNEYLAPSAAVASGVLADDGYRYKAVRRRLRLLRHRRDVSELPSAQYLPPVELVNIPQTPVVSVAPVADIPILNNEYLAPLQQTGTVLANDGYRYKTVRRFKIRRH